MQATILAMTITTSLADAKNRLSEIIQTAVTTHERVTITKNGKPAVVLLSVEDLESLEETLAVLSDDWLMAGIREGEAALAAGDFATEATIRADLAERRSESKIAKTKEK
jgi:antitoxin YefM